MTIPPVAVETRRRLGPEERRAQILEAALAAFEAAPYDEVSMGRIAEASGSSQALVFHYFGSKADLYATIVAERISQRRTAQGLALAALSDGVAVRDRVRALAESYLDHVSSHPEAWAFPLRGGAEPRPAQQVRSAARAAEIADMGELLGISAWPRHTFAVQGWFGFVDQACLHWVGEGCPSDQRGPLVEAALGALEGALGDWAV